MEYPGNQELSGEARQRVLTAFHQVIAKLQGGHADEALIGLEFVLRLDPDFSPAARLQEQLAKGDDIDLGAVLTALQGGTSAEVDQILVDAVEDFNERHFDAAREKALRVIGELPGHPEARALLGEIDEAVKRESQVEQYLARAREALAGGDPQGAAEFVTMAQALDPHHPEISRALAELEQAPPVPPQQEEPTPAAAEPAQEPAGAEAARPVSESGPGLDEPAGSEFAFSFEEPGGQPAFGGFSVDDEGEAPELGGSAGEPAWESAPSDDGGFSFGDEPEAPLGQPGDVSSDVADLFTDDSASAADAAAGEPPAEPSSGADSQRLQELLAQGRELYEGGLFQEAIDVLSRVFLIDPGHEEATRLVEEARARKDEIDRKTEHLLYEAQDAADGGDVASALRLADDVLALQPGHLEALALKDRLAPASAPPAAPAAAASAASVAPEPTADDGEDLFSLPDMEPAGLPPSDLPTSGAEELELPPLGEPEPRPPRGRRSIPWRMVALGAGALLILLVGVFFGSQLLSSGDDGSPAAGVDTVLRQAQELYEQGRADEAVHLLQEYPATGLEQARVARRLAEYQKALAPPTPTPIPSQLPAAEKALDAGRLLEAYTLVLNGLKQFPHDSGLVQLRERILQHEPQVAALVRAREAGDSATALAVTRELAEHHPDDPEFQDELDRHLYNVAVQELRSYNLTGAAYHLQELSRRRPKDAEVKRILDFIQKYKARPADMQLKIFIGSLKPR